MAWKRSSVRSRPGPPISLPKRILFGIDRVLPFYLRMLFLGGGDRAHCASHAPGNAGRAAPSPHILTAVRRAFAATPRSIRSGSVVPPACAIYSRVVFYVGSCCHLALSGGPSQDAVRAALIELCELCRYN